MGALRQLLELRPTPLAERLGAWHRLRLVVEVLVAYVELIRVLRTNDLPAMVRRARRPPSRRAARAASGIDPRDAAVRLGFIVQKVLGVLPTDKRCLIRSLVLTRLLSSRAIDHRVVIGVAVEDGFQAHAWVEHANVPVLPAGRYGRLLDL
jgi:hypothetical protein